MRKIIMVVCVSILLIVNPLMESQGSHARSADAEKSKITSKMAKMQIPFIANEGQVDEQITFYARTFGGTVFVTHDGKLVYVLPASGPEDMIKGVALTEEFVGSTIQEITGKQEAVTRVNYFKGNNPSAWRSNIPTYQSVNFGEVYPGIELKLKAYGDNVEKLFYVNPGTHPHAIKVRLRGAKGLKIGATGTLEADTELGVVKFTKPVAYQEEGELRKEVEVAYWIEGNGYGFSVGDYDPTKALIIDPLLASTFLGGSNDETVRASTLDDSGNVYVIGYTESSDFPTTSGVYDQSHNGSRDVFVFRLSGDLTTLFASTFLGGGGNDDGASITVDGDGNVYIYGTTYSTNFPTTLGAYDQSHNGNEDRFVSKLTADLGTLSASTFLGGSSSEGCSSSVSLDGSGNIYVTGCTYSTNFPTTSDAYDQSYNGSRDAFVSKLDSDLTSLLASTFLGGSGEELSYTVTWGISGDVYVTGWTQSSDFPSTPGAYDEMYNGGWDAFVSRLDSDLTTLSASTFLGGSGDDHGSTIVVDGSGDVYVASDTGSADFPTTPGAYDESFNGGDIDIYVSRFDSELTTLSASTFLGGDSNDHSTYQYSIALDGGGNVYVTGTTYSANFPTTPGAYDVHLNGSVDAFVARLTSDLTTLSASTFLGGSGYDGAHTIVVDGCENVYVVGITHSSDFSTTTGVYDESYNGGSDIFVAKLVAIGSCDCDPGDLNGDGEYDIFDLMKLINKILES